MPLRYMLYELTPTLSEDACHSKIMLVFEMRRLDSFPGAVGGVRSFNVVVVVVVVVLVPFAAEANNAEKNGTTKKVLIFKFIAFTFCVKNKMCFELHLRNEKRFG